MSKTSKRMRLIREKVKDAREHSIEGAIQLLHALPQVKFPQSVEADVRLSINPKKSDQAVKGVVVLPHGIGRKMRTVVIAQDKAQIEAALAAGATRAGFEELVHEIKQGDLMLEGRDVLIATPVVMRLLMPLGPVLGPKGLMPNPKLGTVTDDPAKAVRDALLGRVKYRSDKGGSVRCLIGKLSFSVEQLQKNLQVLLESILKNKPDAASKGKAFIKKITLSSTMGPGLCIEQSSLDLSLSI